MVRQNHRAAGDRAAVAAGFSNDGRALPGNHGFIDAGYAFDDLSVSRNYITRLAVHNVPAAQL